MAKNKTLELSIKIAGKIDKSLFSALTGAKNQISGFSKGIGKIGTVGLATMAALGAGSVKVISDCTKEAANFENYMSDVVKHVDGLADATGKVSNQISKETGKSYAENYAAIKDSILDLSTQIPYLQEDLTSLAAAAGQSGKTLADLTHTDFLKDIAMWGTAMDISADQAGDWGAKWEQAFSMNHDQIMEVADVINYLGNNYATTAAEIAQSVNDSASMGQLAGVDVKATAAIAASMQAMGVGSDRVGTSIKRIYTNITKGTTATKAQQAALKKLGFTAEGVAQAMQIDGTGTLLQVFTAINNLPDADKLSTLNALFGQWAIEGGAKITQNLGLLTKMLDEVSDESVWSGSMEKEFIIKSTTPEALETMRKNTLKALQIEIGDAFLPAKKEFDSTMIDFLNKVRKNMPEIEQLAETLGALASKGIGALGEKMDEWLPKIREGLEWILNNSDQFVSILKTLAGVFTAMKLTPFAEGLVRTAGSLFGKKRDQKLSGLNAVSKMIVNAAIVHLNSKATVDAADAAKTIGKAGAGAGAGTSAGAGTKRGLRGWLAGIGTTISGGLASVGTALGSGATTAAGLAAAGGAGIAGGIGGGAGIISAIIDFFQGANADNAKTAKTEYASGGSKLAMVGAGAGAGALIGSVVPVLGTAIGALIGSGIGGISALLGGDAVGKWISDSTDEGGWMNNVWKAVRGFFVETLPEFVTGTVPEALRIAGDGISGFFTKTVPTFFGKLWQSIGTFLTQTVPYAIGYACGRIEVFFTKTVPQVFADLWNTIASFFTTTLPTWASNIWNNRIVPFFASDIPRFFGDLWQNIKSFFTVTVPTWASNIWSNKIVPFFTSDIPRFVGNLWSSICTFFTSTVPTWANNIWRNNIYPFFSSKLPGFFTNLWNNVSSFVTQTIPSVASSLSNKIKGWMNTVSSWFSDVWNSVKGWFSKGYSAGSSYSAHAWGGIMTTPHIGLVAEAGPEAIIPLSRNKNSRGISLWMQAGRILGVSARHLASVTGFDGFKAYSNGGISGRLPSISTLRAITPRRIVELKDPGESAGNGQRGFSFTPTIIIQGNADRDVIDEALARAKAEFEAWYYQMQRRQARTAY